MQHSELALKHGLKDKKAKALLAKISGKILCAQGLQAPLSYGINGNIDK